MRGRLWILVLLLITAIMGSAQAVEGRRIGEIETTLPARLGPLELGGDKRWRERPDAGVAVSYTSDGIEATLYVYDSGRGPIPSGTRDDVVRTEFTDAFRTIEKVAEMTGAAPAEMTALGTRWFAGATSRLAFLYAGYEQAATGGAPARVSEVYVTGARGHFLKVRITARGAARNGFAETVRRFMADLAALF